MAELLLEASSQQNLVAKSTLPHIWQRHIADSAQLLHVSRETLPPGAWLDLGTGAGFPGLVVAALQPERRVTLVDSRRLRTSWLTQACSQLGLDRVEVVTARVEDLPDAKWEVISARAFAPLEELLALSARFSTRETLWLLPKGAKAAHELATLPPQWDHMFHVEQSLTNPAAGIIIGRLLEGASAPAISRRFHRGRNR
ncbi:16S rRNA (guanine(527)-N(7))-methyltransferase RsmG [Novosphingobium sp. Chol11]|uniref:16S rRNA (guanine(527)-N(7))-methyltransferase RsmG n=1 Tax=Novosphingobium sp. Chol11 TaxID=1385763 RepID=UPI00345BCD84